MKVFCIVAFLSLSFMAKAQYSDRILHIAGGTLSSKLNSEEKAVVQNLFLSGNMNAEDFRVIRDEMPSLITLDISNVVINSYKGAWGTSYNSTPDTYYKDNEIPEWALSDKELLRTVILPGSITGIMNSAFNNCSALDAIDIPGSVSFIGPNAFAECSSLSMVGLMEPLTRILDGAFRDCIALQSINIPRSVNYLGSSVFAGCKSLIAIDIHEYITVIGDNIFAGCENLVTVNLSESLLRIPKYAFRKCSSLTTITIPQLVSVIDEGAFMDCVSLVSVQLPIFLDTIGSFSFFGCKSLADGFDMPIQLKHIGERSFMNCQSLDGTITIPETVMHIGFAAFAYCSNLEHVVNYSSDTLRSMVFNLCSNLKSVSIAQGVKAMESYAFAFCSSLLAVEIPGSVELIGESAFAECSSLESVIINNGVQAIESHAFSGCINLNSIAIPSSVTKIGTYAFNACRNMVNATFNEGLEEIGVSAFSECIGLEKVVIPSSVNSIGSEAFYNCQSLRRLYSLSAFPLGLYDSDFVFQYVDKSECILFVPKGSVSSYRDAYQWGDFFRILEIGDVHLSSKAVKINAPEGSIRTINLKGDAKWSIGTDVEWLSINPKSGEGDASIVFTANENLALETRLATVMVQTEAGFIHQVTFTQDAGSPKLTTQFSEILIGFEYGSNQTIQVESNTEWEATIVEKWLTIDPAKGKGNATITITADENKGDTAREAVLKIFSEGVDTISVLITQMANNVEELYLEVSQNEVTFKSDDSEEILVHINSNVDWTASSDQTWLSVEPKSGSGNSTINLKADNNNQNISRIANVSISYGNNLKVIVIVTQEAMQYSVSNKLVDLAIKVYPNPFKQGIRIEGFSGFASIRIIDLAGKTLIEKDFIGNSFLELDDLPIGIYHVTLFNNEFKQVFKVVKE